MKTPETEIRHYDVDKNMHSHRCKRCHVSLNFTPSENMHDDNSLADGIWLAFRRCALNDSVSPEVESTFECWCRKYVWCKSKLDGIRQHLKSKFYSIVLDGSFFPNRP